MTKKEKIVNLFVDAFFDNPRLNSLIRPGGDMKKKFRLLGHYVHDMAAKVDGAYLSESEDAFMLFYLNSDYKFNLKDAFNYYRFIIFAGDIKNTKSIFERERMVSKLRLDIPNYIYAWFLGRDQKEKSLHSLFEMKDYIYGYADRMQLPILSETINEGYLKMYKRIGFYEYNQYLDKKNNINIWFLRRDPGTKEKHDQD